ncbi:unnamed protein product [Protopolystoma xenopodis]|uniref:Uncharacterized protein n=1 Tax=Protopolystoma xenopodis TaxID=117903 RepID=A0A3S5AU28_9PLAT|nr:unnamed protein product [Protopolystoma xenopodis]
MEEEIGTDPLAEPIFGMQNERLVEDRGVFRNNLYSDVPSDWGEETLDRLTGSCLLAFSFVDLLVIFGLAALTARSFHSDYMEQMMNIRLDATSGSYQQISHLLTCKLKDACLPSQPSRQ